MIENTMNELNDKLSFPNSNVNIDIITKNKDISIKDILLCLVVVFMVALFVYTSKVIINSDTANKN